MAVLSDICSLKFYMVSLLGCGQHSNKLQESGKILTALPKHYCNYSMFMIFLSCAFCGGNLWVKKRLLYVNNYTMECEMCYSNACVHCSHNDRKDNKPLSLLRVWSRSFTRASLMQLAVIYLALNLGVEVCHTIPSLYFPLYTQTTQTEGLTASLYSVNEQTQRAGRDRKVWCRVLRHFKDKFFQS